MLYQVARLLAIHYAYYAESSFWQEFLLDTPKWKANTTAFYISEANTCIVGVEFIAMAMAADGLETKIPVATQEMFSFICKPIRDSSY